MKKNNDVFIYKKFIKYFNILFFLFYSFVVLYSSITNISVNVSDMNGLQRENYSSTEHIKFDIRGISDNNSNDLIINYIFKVKDVSGKEIIINQKNEMTVTAGECGATMIGPVSRFFSYSGKYKFIGKITVKNQKTGQIISENSAETDFMVSSPYLILSYPFDGAKNITDNPLRFSWVSSGAGYYRIYIDDDPAFYNCIFKTGSMDYPDSINTGFEYPQNPVDNKQKLSSGKTYYWKVEGYDNAGNKIADTRTPYSFSIKENTQNIQVRDISLENISIDKNSILPADCKITLLVLVKNLGNQTEVNIKIKIFINGKQILPDKNIEILGAGESRELRYELENIKEKNIKVIATCDLFDNNYKNNIMTMSFNNVVADECLENITFSDPTTTQEFSRIKVRIIDKQTKELIKDARVNIEMLKSGNYMVKAQKDEYITVQLEINKDEIISKTEFNIELEKIIKNDEEKKQEKKAKKYSLSEIQKKIEDIIKDQEILKEFDGYKLEEMIIVPPSEDINELIEGLLQNKIKIKKISVLYE